MVAALKDRLAAAPRTTEATPKKLIPDPSVATGENAHPTAAVGLAFLPDGGSRGLGTASREIAVKVSPGELIDKMTILQIKRRKFTDQAKLANVGHELDLLTSIFHRAVRGSAELDRLTDELRSVNEALWEIEDQIRCCECQQDFGPRFIEVARSVYQQNDRRAAIKRQINDLLNSEIIEEKGYRDEG